MGEDRKARMAALKKQIEQGKYRIDARAVADAIMRRMHEEGTPRNGSPTSR
jgi:anti-sigma28 factor (negative regulator of flagellin synthesis)